MSELPPLPEIPLQTDVTPRSSKMIWIMFFVLITILILMSLVFIYFTFKSKTQTAKVPAAPTQQTQAAIVGKIDLNGAVPAGSLIKLEAQEVNSGTGFVSFNDSLAAVDNIDWQYKGVSGKSYEIRATLLQGSTVLGNSDPVFITAPSKHGVLRINVSTTPNVASASAVISGQIITNGYIPAGSTITVEGRKLGVGQFAVIAKNIAATAKQYLTYSSAITDQQYEVRGELMNAGKIIGQSNTIVITAPAENEELTINSNAQAPAQSPAPLGSSSTQSSSPTLSGIVNLNGAVPPNGSVVILGKVTGTSDYQVVVNNVSPTDGAVWVFKDVQTGTSYDLKAVLKQPQANGTFIDAAVSNGITATAPAADLTFTINSGFQLPGPTGAITLACGVKNGGANNWTASISFDSVAGAQSYWYQVGTSNGGSDLINTTQPWTNNNTQTINVTLNDSVIYYGRYAYSTTANASQNQFSPFSYVQSFKCPK